MLDKYLAYFKDNPQHLWFKRKIYGWGWTPVTWQGWLATFAAVAVILWSGRSLAQVAQPTDAMLTWFFIKLGLTVGVLIFICYKKGESPRWQWGIPDKGSDSDHNNPSPQ